jgi:hypothetical protein
LLRITVGEFILTPYKKKKKKKAAGAQETLNHRSKARHILQSGSLLVWYFSPPQFISHAYILQENHSNQHYG